MNPIFPFFFRRGLVFAALLGIGLSCTQAVAQPIVLTNLVALTNGTAMGDQPVASLVLGAGEVLYGTTFNGGSNASGAVFKMDLDGRGYALIHSFLSTDTQNDGVTFNPSTAANSLPIIQGNDRMIYGVSTVGGTNSDGMVYRMAPDGSGYAVIHSFGASDSSPHCLIQGGDGALYGAGTALFRLTTDGTTYQVLHTFNKNSSDGIVPYGLTQGSDGMLYGTTYLGGSNNNGAVFKATTDGLSFGAIHSFASTNGDGKNPTSLIQGTDGFLYGTAGGGSNGTGAVFKMATDGSSSQVLYSFAGGSDASLPFGRLVESGGVLYGTTRDGGSGDGGTIFKVSLTGTGYGILYNFPAIVLGTPFAGLTQGPALGNTGVLYGAIAQSGSDPHDGTIFAMLLNPPVSITPVTGQTAGGQTVVFWPAWAAGYVLQTSTNLTATNWVTVSNATPLLGVQLTNSSITNFYRLVFP